MTSTVGVLGCRDKRIWQAGVLLLGAFLTAGCTMIARGGGGPLPRQCALEAYGAPFGVMSAEQTAKFATLESNTDWARLPVRKTVLPPSKHCLSARIATDSTGNVLLCGLWPQTVTQATRVEQNGELHTLFEQGTILVPGFPLLWPLWLDSSSVYLKDTGEEIRKTRLHGLGLGGVLAGHMSYVAAPLREGDSLKTLENAQNLSLGKIWYLGGGILAIGRINHYHYGQFLWIPFRMGSAD